MNGIDAQTPVDDANHRAVNAFCARIGADRLLVQGAGGNVSWKEADTMWVKASGRWLAHAQESEIFVPVDLAALRMAIDQGDFDSPAVPIGDSALKPSIETMLHALMPYPFVAHLHAIEPLAYLVRAGGVAALGRKMPADTVWQSAPYLKPGAALAQGLADALRATPDLDMVLLENHGVVMGAGSVQELEEMIRTLTAAVAITPEPHRDRESVTVSAPSFPGYHLVEGTGIQNLALDPDAFARLKRDWALFPDHVVFLGAAAVTFESRSAAAAALADADTTPELIFVANDGVFANDAFNEAKRVQLQCYRDVMIRQGADDIIVSLDDSAVGELLNWDAERYRMTLNKT